ncbi:MAG: DUF4242 domain-containing protein [Bacteroidetes bacterium]|nr:MAG: DUF4242 domain-containing protein [Bacteroidota bacterium]
MKKFIIERILPGAGDMSAEELRAVSKTSVDVITEMGKAYSWVQSFVTADKIYCIHIAESKADIRAHSKCGNLPVNAIEEIKQIIDPATAA